MKTLIGIAIAVIAGAVIASAGWSLARSNDAPDRPPGVAADRWAPISTTLGVVLVPDSGLSAESPLPAGGQTAPAGGPMAEPKIVVGAVDPTALIAPPTAAVRKVIEEGQPVRGYIMVKRGKLWRPLLVVAPTVNS
jgi:hypothetical protein